MKNGHAGKLIAQREAAIADGRPDEAGWVDKHLAAAGLSPGSMPPQTAAAERAAAADDDEGRAVPPRGRASRQTRQAKAAGTEVKPAT
jgi:hypothetical protein